MQIFQLRAVLEAEQMVQEQVLRLQRAVVQAGVDVSGLKTESGAVTSDR